MAVDTKEKRTASAAITPMNWFVPAYVPEGDIDAKDRSQLAGSYRFELAPPEPGDSNKNWVNVSIRGARRRGGS